MGVRTSVPFSELTPGRDIVFNGPAVKKHILKPKKGDDFAELDFTYFNAVYTRWRQRLAKAKDERGLKRVARFLKRRDHAPTAEITRLSAATGAPHVRGLNLAEASAMTLEAAVVVARRAGISARRPCGH